MITAIARHQQSDVRRLTLQIYDGWARENGVSREEVGRVFDAIDLEAIARTIRYSSDYINAIHDEMAKGLTAILNERIAAEQLAEADRLWGVLS